MTEVEKFQAEARAGLTEQRLVGLEADVAPGVVVEPGDPLGKRGNRSVERRVGEIVRALDGVGVGEGGLGDRLGRLLGESRPK